MNKADKILKDNPALNRVFKVPGKEIYFRDEARATAYGSNHGVELEVIERSTKKADKKPDADPAAADLKELRKQYKELAGKGASPKWTAEEVQAKITELTPAE